MFVRSCSSINNKIITFKKLFHHSQLGAPQKEKKSGGPAAAGGGRDARLEAIDRQAAHGDAAVTDTDMPPSSSRCE